MIAVGLGAATANGTDAIEITLRALGVDPGGKCILPATRSRVAGHGSGRRRASALRQGEPDRRRQRHRYAPLP